MMQQLSKQDAYAIGRALMGKEPVEGLSVTPLAGMLVEKLKGQPEEKLTLVKEFFGQEILQQIFAVAVDGDPPLDNVERLGAFVPPLPKRSQVEQPDQAVGVWLDEYMDWITSRATTTEAAFLQAGGLWLIGLATARRAVLHLSIGDFYNNLYVLWCAPTTVFAKSTGMRFVEAVARQAIPHLLLASNNTPELLLYKLAGNVAENIEKLSGYHQELEREGQKYAGQRGSIVDEAASLFGGKKYMEGLVDLFMQLYDCPSLVEHEFKTQGKLVVDYPALLLLLGTTPARLQEVFGDGEWNNGLLPRFALLTPEGDPKAPPPVTRWDESMPVPGDLVTRLQRLHQKLPQPERYEVTNDSSRQQLKSLRFEIDDEALAMFNAYKDGLWHMLMRLDQRLAGVYGRLHVQALKIAMSLRLVDWADQSEGGLMISAPYWQKAQIIAERWRASAHRLLAELNYSADMRHEDQVMQYLRLQQKAQSLRLIHRGTSIPREQDVKRAVQALYNDGQIVKVQIGNQRGEAYMLA